MGMKNIFQRWKNGLLGYRTSPEEIPTIGESLTQYRNNAKTKKAVEWCSAIRSSYARSFSCQWSPWDKFLWLYGLSDRKPEARVRLYEYFGCPTTPMIPDEHVDLIVALTKVLGDESVTHLDRRAAVAYCRSLNRVLSNPDWVALTKDVFPSMVGGENRIVDEYIRQQYSIRDANIAEYKLAILVWDISGRPDEPDYSLVACPTEVRRLECKYYHKAFRKLQSVIADWAQLGWRSCCDFPQELTPGVMALYDHHCRFKEKEPVMVDKSVTLVLLERVATSIAPAQWHVAIDGKHYPVKLGGIPEDLDAFTKPFYKFTNDRPEGENICKVLIASGTDGHYWTFVINETYDILAIWDNDEEPMLGVTIPVDSKAISLFRIDCSLKSVL